MRAFARGARDANEHLIVAALRLVGADVVRLDTPADLLVGFRGRNWLLEVKDPAKAPSARRLTPDQEAFAQRWPGQWARVETVDEALRALGALRR